MNAGVCTELQRIFEACPGSVQVLHGSWSPRMALPTGSGRRGHRYP